MVHLHKFVLLSYILGKSISKSKEFEILFTYLQDQSSRHAQKNDNSHDCSGSPRRQKVQTWGICKFSCRITYTNLSCLLLFKWFYVKIVNASRVEELMFIRIPYSKLFKEYATIIFNTVTFLRLIV